MSHIQDNAHRTGAHRAARWLALAGLVVAAGAWANDPDRKFKDLDADGNGSISAAEHAAGVGAMFDRMDADRSGTVTAAEMDAAHRMKGDDRKAGASGHPPGQHGAMDREAHQGGHDMGPRKSSADKIAKMDTNGDGALSASEHANGAQAMFQEWDTDRSGSLSRQEMAKGHAMKKNRAPER